MDNFFYCSDAVMAYKCLCISKLIKWYSLCVVYNTMIIAHFFKETFRNLNSSGVGLMFVVIQLFCVLDLQDGGCLSGLVHVPNLNLSQLALTGNTCPGNLP